jgi:hypothetical protein
MNGGSAGQTLRTRKTMRTITRMSTIKPPPMYTLDRLLAYALNIVGQITEEPGNRRRQGRRAGHFLHAGTWAAADFNGDADMAEAVDLTREIPHVAGYAGSRPLVRDAGVR